jgi:hypothetical protein
MRGEARCSRHGSLEWRSGIEPRERGVDAAGVSGVKREGVLKEVVCEKMSRGDQRSKLKDQRGI